MIIITSINTMKIVMPVVNNPTFIEIQYYTFKKYMKCDYEFIVFNDAKNFPDYTNYGDVTLKTQIKDMCNKYNITCIDIPNDHHITLINATDRNAESMNFILQYKKQHLDNYLVLDSDMFLIDEFDVSKYSDNICAIVLQSRINNNTNETINYMWNGICYLDMLQMKNIELFDWSLAEHCDCAGSTQHWLKSHMGNTPMPNTDEIRWTDKTFHTNHVYFMKHLWSTSWDLSELPENLKNRPTLIDFLQNDMRNENGKFFCEIYDNCFLHYRAGCNWMSQGENTHKIMTERLKIALL